MVVNYLGFRIIKKLTHGNPTMKPKFDGLADGKE
jgi:hypothetical protein